MIGKNKRRAAEGSMRLCVLALRDIRVGRTFLSDKHRSVAEGYSFGTVIARSIATKQSIYSVAEGLSFER